MAKIVLGMGSSHGPMLSTPPEEWGQRVLADRKNKEHYYKSKTWTFDQLVEARKGENLGKQIELPVWRERHAACRKALGPAGAGCKGDPACGRTGGMRLGAAFLVVPTAIPEP